MAKPLIPKPKSRNPLQLQQRLKMLANGWPPIPCEGKARLIEDWNTVRIDEAQLRAWDGYGAQGCKLAGTGTRVEGLMFIIDLDGDDIEVIDAVLDALEADATFGDCLADGLWRSSGGASWAIFMQCSEVVAGRHSATYGHVEIVRDADGNDVEVISRKTHLETYGGATRGKYFAAFGPHSKSGREYTWSTESPVERSLSSLPAFPAQEIGRLHDTVEAAMAACGLTPIAPAHDASGLEVVYDLVDDSEFVLEDGTPTTAGALEKSLGVGLDNGVRGVLGMSGWRASDSKKNCHAFVRDTNLRLTITDFRTETKHYWADEAKPEPPRLDAEDLRAAWQQVQADATAKAATADEDEDAPEEPRSTLAGVRFKDIPRDPKDPEVTYKIATGWLLENVAFYKQAFNGRGGAVDIYPDDGIGKPITIASLQFLMMPFGYESIGPRGGSHWHNPVSFWVKLPNRVKIAGIRMRPDETWPLFVEDGETYINRYHPPRHTAPGGSVKVFLKRLERLVPDLVERTWVVNWLACLVQYPHWRMVALAMVARATPGTGRGMLAETLQLVLGWDFVAPIPYTKLSGGAGSRFNAEIADKLLVYINESRDADDRKFSHKNAAREALKDFIEPNHELPFRVEPKGLDAYTTRASISTLIFTNNIDGLPISESDRRVAVVMNGAKMTVAEREEYRDWIRKRGNIGALYRFLRDFPIEQDKSKFDPFIAPDFIGHDLMIDAGKTAIDHAYEAAIAKLKTATDLATMDQILAVTRYFLRARLPDQDELIRRHTTLNGFRIGTKHSTNWLVRYGDDEDNRQRVYAFDEESRIRWTTEKPEAIKAQLDKAQRVVDTPARKFNKLLHSIPNDEKNEDDTHEE